MNAVLSPDGMYRYRLDRQLGLFQGFVVAWFGVNPSTADATVDDATSRRWKGFSLRWGAHAYVAGNVFAYRSTDVSQLARVTDPVGPDNAVHIEQIIAQAQVLVPCWGSRNKLPKTLWPHLDALRDRLLGSGKPVRVLGLTASGDPEHPLLVPYERPLRDWAAAHAVARETSDNSSARSLRTS